MSNLVKQPDEKRVQNVEDIDSSETHSSIQREQDDQNRRDLVNIIAVCFVSLVVIVAGAGISLLANSNSRRNYDYYYTYYSYSSSSIQVEQSIYAFVIFLISCIIILFLVARPTIRVQRDSEQPTLRNTSRAAAWSYLQVVNEESRTDYAHSSRDYQPPTLATTPVNQRTPLDVARDAIRATGNDPDDHHERVVSLVDIGLLAYDDRQEATIYRDQTIGAGIQHIRPFVNIHVHLGQGVQGMIRMELIDAAGQTRFNSDSLYGLEYGENLVTSKTWLRLGERESGGGWFLRVYIAGGQMAQHRFYIEPDAAYRTLIGDDGELAVPMQSSGSRLSLNQLLEESPDPTPTLSAEDFFARSNGN